MPEKEAAITVGQQASEFSLPSIQGEMIKLHDYRGRRNIWLWFSRGFTCNFCWGHMENIAAGSEMIKPGISAGRALGLQLPGALLRPMTAVSGLKAKKVMAAPSPFISPANPLPLGRPDPN